MAVLVSVMVWGLTFWGLQQAWSYVAGEYSLQLYDALLFGWGALLELPPPINAKGLSGQVHH